MKTLRVLFSKTILWHQQINLKNSALLFLSHPTHHYGPESMGPLCVTES